MAASPGSTTVGLAGLGNLGLPLALTLVSAGWNVRVLDTLPERTHPCVSAGASAATSYAELTDCDVLVLVVPGDAEVRAAVSGKDGYLSTGRSGRTVVVHSTVLPSTAQRLAVDAGRHDVGFVDAPVSGGADRAATGELTVMAGGEDAAVAAVRPLLDTVGSRVLHVGPAGAGAATKLANQLMMFAALAGVHEALDLARGYGVAERDVLDATSTGTGDSWAARTWGFFDRTAAAYDDNGTPVRDRPWSKDLAEVVEAARGVGVAVPVAAQLAQLLPERVEAHAAEARDRDGR